MRASTLLATSVLVLATACGSGQDVTIVPVDGDSPGIAMLAAAADSTAQIDSGRVSLVSGFTIDSDEAQVADEYPMAGPFDVEVAAEFSGADVSFATETSGLGSGLFGDGPSDGVASSESRVVDGVMYMRNDFLGDDRWYVLGSDFGGVDGEDPWTGEIVDVAALTEFPRDLLEGAAGQVEDLGIEEVKAGPATHYRVVVAGDTVADSELASEFGFETPGDTPIDFWVNDDDLMVKLATSSRAMGVESSVTMEFFDLGMPITIDAPPDAVDFDLGSFGDLFGDLEGFDLEDADVLDAGDATEVDVAAPDSVPAPAPDLGAEIGTEVAELDSLRVILEDLGVDPAVVDQLPGLVEEARVLSSDMGPEALDAYIDLQIVDLVGENEVAQALVRAYVDLTLPSGG